MMVTDLQPALAEVAEAVVPAAVDWTPLPDELAALRYVEPPEGAHPTKTSNTARCS